ncbi:InlB B-repeat-containing protein, partial [Lachnospiraceae bacterium 47-T17]
QWSKDVVNYTVSFDAQGGSAVPSQTVAENGKLGTLPSTGRSGYTFTGWYTQAGGGSKVTGNEEITGDVTYYAQWSRNTQNNQNVYTVSFDAQGGSPVAVQTVTENGIVPYIPATYRAGYIFMGWYTNVNGYGSQLTSTTIITNHTIYYAYWLTASSTNNTGNVISNAANTNEAIVLVGNGNDGEYVQINVQVGLYDALQSYYPCKPGYEFKGWYMDVNFTQPVTKDSGLSNGMKIYAKWEKIYNWKLNKKKATLMVGKTTTLKVTGLANSKVTWKSLNPKIATVSANGKVKAKKAGKVKIIVITKDGSVMGCTVVVKKKK